MLNCKKNKHSVPKFLSYFAGFTLAETLITLVIVGVIAALTVPNMIVHYQKEVTVTRLKKAYSTLNSALQTSIFENGSIDSWDCAFVLSDNAEKRRDCMKKYFVPYMKIIKGCYYNEVSAKECWEGNTSWYNNITGTSGGYCVDSSVILDDGTFIGISCTSSYPDLIIDINGRSKPNRLGKDVFRVGLNKTKGRFDFSYSQYTREQLVQDMPNTSNGGSCVRGTKRYDGLACGALILKDGWQIKDDYPW